VSETLQKRQAIYWKPFVVLHGFPAEEMQVLVKKSNKLKNKFWEKLASSYKNKNWDKN
jgi:hypothetical protein